MFSEPEVNYLKSQRLARVATVSKKGQPDVVPVALEFDGKYFWIGGHGEHARKYRNVASGNERIALAIDDVESFSPWKARAIRVYGTAEIFEHKGLLGPGKYIRVTPRVSWSFGIQGVKGEGAMNVAKTIHE
jgi:pyridoxamine 5'-phosphate oxidase family protein